jgi:hypothetical protein
LFKEVVKLVPFLQLQNCFKLEFDNLKVL